MKNNFKKTISQFEIKWPGTISKSLSMALMLLFLATTGNSQFSVNESFSGSSAANAIIIGGTPNAAYLTSNVDDPPQSGWLRLTKNSGNQSGFAYINTAFPTSQGVLVEFEYKTWRDVDNPYHGADGIGIFLFDALYGPNGGSDGSHDFTLGGNGGSLGYAPRNGSVSTGLSGGYIGLGIDEYGNYSNPNEGRIGGPGFLPNAIALRGPTTSDASTTNPYWAGTGSMGDNISGEMDYDSIVSTRPSDDLFYRKVHIEITPIEDAQGAHQYKIYAAWKKSPLDGYDSLFSYTTTVAPPEFLKIGFEASTGGGSNYHEIRNLQITTPGGVRVTKTQDKANLNIGDTVKYNLTMYNDASVAIDSLPWSDTLKDGLGNVIASGTDFEITNVAFNNNGYTDNVPVGDVAVNQNVIQGKVAMAASSSVSYIVTGVLHTLPANNTLYNKVTVYPGETGLTDNDPTNDTAFVITSAGVPVSGYVFNDNNGGTPDGNAYAGATLKLVNNNGDTVNTATTDGTGNYIFNAVKPGDYTVKLAVPAGFSVTGNTEDTNLDTLHVTVSTDSANNNNFGINQPPVAVNDALDNQPSGTAVTVPDITANDYDYNNGTIAGNTINLLAPADVTGSTVLDTNSDGYNDKVIVPDQGTWVLNANYSVTFTPLATFTENPAPLPYTVNDNAGLKSNIAYITIQYTATPLPVKIGYFNAAANGKTVIVSWNTLTEENNKGFEVQRSANGKTWDVIGWVSSAANGGNSSQEIKYQFVDNQPLNGDNYYRLRQVNIDGDADYSLISKVNMVNSGNLNIYPNPATEEVNITGLSGMETVSLSDISGREIYSARNGEQTSLKIQLNQLSAGHYYLKVTSKDGALSVFKLEVVK